MRLTVVDHPLVATRLARLRAAGTDGATFRRLADELTTLLAYEATLDLPVEPETVTTPVGEAPGVRLAGPAPLVVPVLRAGLGMLDAMLRLLPSAEVGFLGMLRDEDTLQASTYADRVPARLDGRRCYVLDPMLATGGTLTAALGLLLARGASDVVCLTLVAAPEGLARLQRDLADRAGDVGVVTAAVDAGLTAAGFITPGLGDAGDRLYGPL